MLHNFLTEPLLSTQFSLPINLTDRTVSEPKLTFKRPQKLATKMRAHDHTPSLILLHELSYQTVTEAFAMKKKTIIQNLSSSY